MKAYSTDLKQLVPADCDRREGTRREIAKRFGVSLARIYRLW